MVCPVFGRGRKDEGNSGNRGGGIFHVLRASHAPDFLGKTEYAVCAVCLPSGVLLSVIGYNTATAYDEKVVNGIYTITCIVPAAGFVLLALSLWFLYPLGKTKVEENARILKERRDRSGM